MNTLEKYHPGDDSWRKFADSFSAHWEQCNFKNELLEALHGHEDLAKVIFAAADTSALSWIINPIPALDGLSPQECICSEAQLKRLQVMLMRFPF